MTTRQITALPAHTEYTVQAHDSLTKIALNQYGISRYDQSEIQTVVESITQINDLPNANHILIGQVLKLPEVTLTENQYADAQVAYVKRVEVVQAPIEYTVGYLIAEPEVKMTAVTVEVKGPLSWHLDRNENMVCPTRMPENSSEWFVNQITMNPFSAPHGYGNYDVRGLHDKAGTQCIYSPEGELISDKRAGTWDYSSPVNPETGKYEAARVWGHFWQDVLPEMLIASHQPALDDMK